MSAIITDTLILTSPTTTQTDQEVVLELEKIAGISHKVWGTEIFSAVEGFAAEDKELTIRADYKHFKSKLGVYGVSQVEVGSLGSLTKSILG